ANGDPQWRTSYQHLSLCAFELSGIGRTLQRSRQSRFLIKHCSTLGIRCIRSLFEHELIGPTLRYGIAGGTVGLVYLILPLLLKSVLHLPIALTIAIGYVIAVTLHFNLQRHFVFRHVRHAFKLTRREQIGRYIVMGAIQYPLTLASTALLPGALNVPQRDVYVGTVLVVALGSFLVLRTVIFHADGGAATP
ncbi:MAG: GtrA family protein, partial [Solirubrobacteraceae bacterium]